MTLALTGSAIAGTNAGITSGATASLSTSGTDNLVVAIVHARSSTTQASIVSFTDGLGWQRRFTHQVNMNSGDLMTTEVWWVYVAASWFLHPVTPVFDHNVGRCETCAFAFSGANSIIPFDVNVALPAIVDNTSITNTGTHNVTFSTTKAAAALIEVLADDAGNLGSGATPDTGYTLLKEQNNSTMGISVAYQVVSSAQSSVTENVWHNYNTNSYTSFIDAIQGVPDPVTSTTAETLPVFTQLLNADITLATSITTLLPALTTSADVVEREPSNTFVSWWYRGQADDLAINVAADLPAITDIDVVPTQGAPGNDGLDGQDGDMGFPGPTGPQGPIGPQGVPGSDGSDGSDGDRGSQGFQGSPGLDGRPGVDGSDGDDGPPGPQGSAGTVGPMGPQGQQGSDGDHGQDGDMGPPGQPGQQGIQGVQGTPGSDGDDGDHGQDGDIGPPGLVGLQGPQGLIGIPGSDGQDGDDNLGHFNTGPLSRELLIAARTYYIRTDGADTNVGTVDSATGGFLTIQHAVDVVAGLDLGTYAVTIQVDDGTYTGTVVVSGAWHGSGASSVTIQGNSSTPTNVSISTGANIAFTVQNGGTLTVKDLGIVTTSGIVHLYATNNSTISFTNISFGVCGLEHLRADTQSRITATGNYAITGATSYHAVSLSGSNISIQGRTLTITNTPAFAQYFGYVERGGILAINACTFTGSATGARYSALSNGVIYTNGAATTYLPGNAAGTTLTGGQYV